MTEDLTPHTHYHTSLIIFSRPKCHHTDVISDATYGNYGSCITAKSKLLPPTHTANETLEVRQEWYLQRPKPEMTPQM